MKRLHISLLFAACFAACTDGAVTHNGSAAATDTTETDTINYALNEDSINLQLNNTTPPEGFYSVTLPCTNCKGIEHTVLFNRDLSYRLEENVLGNETNVTATTGSWKPVNGDIWLYKDSSVVARYTWKGDTLHYVDLKSGVRIPLRSLPNAMNVAAWKDKQQAGIDVFGTGTEPFWNLTIDEQKSMVLTLADRPEPASFKPSKPIATADSMVYQSHNGLARLRVVVYQAFCTDGMSDNLYANKIKVVYNDTVYQGCGLLYK